jgi:hypothetical protein
LFWKSHSKELTHGIGYAWEYQGAYYRIGYSGKNRPQAGAASGWRLGSLVLVLLSGFVSSSSSFGNNDRCGGSDCLRGRVLRFLDGSKRGNVIIVLFILFTLFTLIAFTLLGRLSDLVLVIGRLLRRRVLPSRLLALRVLVFIINLLDDKFDDNASFLCISRSPWSHSISLILVSLVTLKSFDEVIKKAHDAAFSALFGLSFGGWLISSRFDWGEAVDLSVEVYFVGENKLAPKVQVDRSNVWEHSHCELRRGRPSQEAVIMHDMIDTVLSPLLVYFQAGLGVLNIPMRPWTERSYSRTRASTARLEELVLRWSEPAHFPTSDPQSSKLSRLLH